MMLLALQRPDLRISALSRLDMENTEKCWTECAHRQCNDRQVLQYNTALAAATIRIAKLCNANPLHVDRS